MQYQSDIVEEKVYALSKKDESQRTDVRLLEYGKEAYRKDDYIECFRLLLSLVEKYDRVNENDLDFIMDLRISFDIIARHFDADAELVKRNTDSLAILNDLFHSTKQQAMGKQFIEFWKRAYYLHCLYNHNYRCAQYGELHNCVYGPRIVPEEMSFFECGDVGKTLLVYDGGGIGCDACSVLERARIFDPRTPRLPEHRLRHVRAHRRRGRDPRDRQAIGIRRKAGQGHLPWPVWHRGLARALR